jgi:hypothetical protein
MTEFDSWLLRQLWAYEDQQELEELANDSDSNPSNFSNNEPDNL